MKIAFGDTSTGSAREIKIQGSKDGTEWATLYTSQAKITSLTEVDLTNTDYYRYYRFYASYTDSRMFAIYEWQTSEYTEIVTEVIT